MPLAETGIAPADRHRFTLDGAAAVEVDFAILRLWRRYA